MTEHSTFATLAAVVSVAFNSTGHWWVAFWSALTGACVILMDNGGAE